jgi:hypothetical protein
MIPYFEGDNRQFAGKFHYYVVMPHFFPTASKKLCREIIEAIPQMNWYTRQKNAGLKGSILKCTRIFRKDIYHALSTAKDILKSTGNW